ncbi:hypothetical protein TKK_0010599 [Trichogramma kaykai]
MEFFAKLKIVLQNKNNYDHLKLLQSVRKKFCNTDPKIVDEFICNKRPHVYKKEKPPQNLAMLKPDMGTTEDYKKIKHEFHRKVHSLKKQTLKKTNKFSKNKITKTSPLVSSSKMNQFDGQTALEWAVANLLPDMVGVLLYYGADLSNFFFPDEEQFLEVLLTEELDMYGPVDLPAGLMAVIEQLEKRGYRLDLYDVYTMIVILIDGEYNMNLGEAAILCEEEEFANKAKRVLVKPGLSLYDLVGSRAARTAESVTYREYYDFARSKKLNDLAEKYREACALPISESMGNRFFLNWALKTILRVRDEDNDTSGSIVASVLDKYLTLTVVGWSSSPERNVDDIGDCHCTNVYRM